MEKDRQTWDIAAGPLRLRPRTREEMCALKAHEADPEMKQAYKEMLDAMAQAPGREEWAAEWRMEDAQGADVGGIGFKGPPDADGRVEIGYGVAEPFRRRGYAGAAVAALCAWALAQPGVRCVCAQTEPGNAVSQRVLAKNGFVPAGQGTEGPLFERRACAAAPPKK